MTDYVAAPKLWIEVAQAEIVANDGQVALGTVNHATGKSASALVGTIMDFDLKQLITSLRSTVEGIGEAFRPKEGGIESSEVKFGVKVNASGNVYVATAGADVTLEVTLKWKREPAPPSPLVTEE